KATVSYLAKEFNLTKATISDTIKILEQKEYVKKALNEKDSRSSTLELTVKGLEMVLLTEDFTDPVYNFVKDSDEKNKIVLWNTVSSLIQQLNHLQVINVQSTCFNCGYFSQQKGDNYC